MSRSQMSGSRAEAAGARRSVVGRARRSQRSRTPFVVVGSVVLALVALFAVYTSSTTGDTVASDRYDVGDPGIGATAPDFVLPDVTAAAAGGPAANVRLSDYRGETVLLYFHEGLGCQPCWDQIRDLEADPGLLASVGIDRLLTITSGPQDLIAQKMRDDGLTAPALADTGLAVSAQWEANRFGMMGNSRNGHTFVLVGPDGVIEWRADYGGPPNYTMYVPGSQLLDDLRATRQAG
ncbi:redoxin domain-containing protein [Pseudonocardia sp. KRD-184]|uniref:Redoxin domain-containing protein n=1 Tax=Pseudonocardia oceani TaxID=2792013 RepID=A0ABS6U2U5_9PSEU|nr:redoxin domain-containing protein [Pseudonocardia oceani]MBW0090388.1 redoxin domain-containing protein [Pseudonocardia oceani]MBW0097573.1 redoxin domain-containing protein [Pseudonocardia oceani]MBW0120915.1 redoxin domain-containing protein [Pseudonocardia oceani]MBW0126543.1 redoxin domain-containing protein [Pseudonocardia oceani]